MPYTIPLPQTLPNWHLKEGTKNKKLTGGDSLKKVAATVSSWQTCSKHCPMFNKCYAKVGFHTRQNGNAVTTKGRGSDFDGFLQNIEDLRNNSFLRPSVSGDLPSEDWCYSTDERKIDLSKLQAIKKAVQSTNTTAFTYTHLHCDPKHRQHNLNAVKEVANKDWIEYGEDNNYFQYLIDRYNGSPTNSAAINGISQQIYGKGINATDANKKPEDYAKMITLLKPND